MPFPATKSSSLAIRKQRLRAEDEEYHVIFQPVDGELAQRTVEFNSKLNLSGLSGGSTPYSTRSHRYTNLRANLLVEIIERGDPELSERCETTSSNFVWQLPLEDFPSSSQNIKHKQARSLNLHRFPVQAEVYLQYPVLYISDRPVSTYFARFVRSQLQSNPMTLLRSRGRRANGNRRIGRR